MAAQDGGCFSLPSEDSVAYTEFCLIFASNLAPTITQQQKRALFVEAMTLVTWTKQQEENSGIPQNTLSAFSALPAFAPHTGNIARSYRATGREGPARWLYAFVLIPFHCFQQRKMRPFPCQRKLTHTDDAGGSDPHRDPHGETSGRNTWDKEFPTASFLR